ncbi:PREDICTED: protein rolling stone-like [Branchiostoma belcheri]|uniref:Protein rolling stone-like n=1 Tax=Branchiostoma belcheri TaxID=7741 RepID=A0A6P4YEQ7_BRABE|nr:PREDICTED: protein rolling stone-like [Branchiostoma belcheri]
MSSCREEFSLAALRLQHHDRSVFSRSPWWRGQVGFVVYKSLIAVLTLAVLVFLLVYHYHVQGRSDPWPVALTNWSFTILTAHMLVALAVCVVDFLSKQKGTGPTTVDNTSENSSPGDAGMEEAVPMTEIGRDNDDDAVQSSSGPAWYHKVHWVLHNTSIAAAFLVTTVYWTLDRATVSVSSIFEHVVNSVIALLDLSLSGTPVRILNVIYPVAYAATYAVFYVIYWAAGGKGRDGATAIYAVMDFGNSPGMASGVMVAFVFVGAPVFHLLSYGLYRLREVVVSKLERRTPVILLSSETTNSRNVHSQLV